MTGEIFNNHFYCKFTAECVGKKCENLSVFDVGYDKTFLWLTFLDHSVVDGTYVAAYIGRHYCE